MDELVELVELDNYDKSNINSLIFDITEILNSYLAYISLLSNTIDCKIIFITIDNILNFFIYILDNIDNLHKNKDIILHILNLIINYIFIINNLIVFYVKIKLDNMYEIIYNSFILFNLLNILENYVNNDSNTIPNKKIHLEYISYIRNLVYNESIKGKKSSYYLIEYDKPQDLISNLSLSINKEIKPLLKEPSLKAPSLKASIIKGVLKKRICCNDINKYLSFTFTIIKLLDLYISNTKKIKTLKKEVIKIEDIIPILKIIIEKNRANIFENTNEKDEIIINKLYSNNIIVKIVDFIFNLNHELYKTKKYNYVVDGHYIIELLNKFKTYLNDNKTTFEYEEYYFIDNDEITKKQLTIEDVDIITGNFYKKDANEINEIKCNKITFESIEEIQDFLLGINDLLQSYFLAIINLLKDKIAFSFYPDINKHKFVFIDNIELFIYYIINNYNDIVLHNENVLNVIIDIIKLIKYCNYYLIKCNEYKLILNGVENIKLLNIFCKCLKSEDLDINDVKCENTSNKFKIINNEDFFRKFDNIKLNHDIRNDYKTSSEMDKSNILNKIEEYSTKISNINIIEQDNKIIFSGGKNKDYKKTENKIKVIYKKKEYTRNIYINERKKYVKINNTFILLSKLKKI